MDECEIREQKLHDERMASTESHLARIAALEAERDAERARADALAARCLELKGKLAEVGNERDGLRR